MKKITFLLTLLLMFAGMGVSRAQSDLVSDAPANGTFASGTKWYTIKSANNNYIATNGDHVDGNGYLKLVGTKPTDIHGYWCLTGDATNGYQLRNAAFPATMVLGMTGSEAAARANLYYEDETDNGVTKRFDLTSSTVTQSGDGGETITISGLNIKIHGSANNGFNNRDGYLALWNSSGISGDAGSTYVFESVADVTPLIQKLRVNYSITDSHTNYSGRISEITTNGSTAQPDLSYFYGSPTFGETNKTVAADNHNFTLTVSSENAPFEFSTPGSPKWYTMKTRNENNRYVVRLADDNIATGGRNDANATPFNETYINTFDKLEGAMWAFVQDGGGVKLYNRKGQKYVTTTGNGVKASLTDNGTTYIVNTSSQTGNGFSLKQPGSIDSYLGSHQNGTGNENSNIYLGTWSSNEAQNDPGSCYTIATIDATQDALAIARSIYTTTKKSEYNGTHDSYIGDVDTEIERNANGAGKVEAVIALKDTPLNLNLVDTKKYFRIIFKRGTAAMTNMYANRSGGTAEEADNSYIAAWADANGEIEGTSNTDNQRAVVVKPNIENGDIASIWQFEEISGSAGQYYIKHANTGFYLGYPKGEEHLHLLANSTDTDKAEHAGHYSITTNSSALVEKTLTGENISGDNKILNTIYKPGTTNQDNNGRGITVWKNGFTDIGNIVYFKEVTEIPVNISAVGYSTLNLPFAVRIPEGVTAYTVTSVNDDQELMMNALSDVIPANTAVILGANSESDETRAFTFTIEPEEADAVTGNILTGTTLERHGMEALSYYGLANKSEGVAFYVASSTEVPANKAILKKSDIPAGTMSANALTFFGGTTGIGHVEAEPSADGSNVYYNLNGIRVLYPSHGIYVKGNGQKVFIK